jgi:2-oxoglutarate ferredoxin oxidoreductase subunit delta
VVLLVEGGDFLLARSTVKEHGAFLTVNQKWCKGCGICIAFCPREALFLNDKGKAEVISDKCTVCGVCELFCPDFALSLIKRRISANAGS